jgi:hypothetical protein
MLNMDNYEINILRRNGNWNKITQNDDVMNTNEENNDKIQNKNHNDYEHLNDDFKFYLKQVSSIINKIESLEEEKNNLKNQLKIYELEFINKKKDTENKINLMTEERDILDKTINVIKNLKSI